jgi:pyridoxal 5'-phosphate synthase pdxS subunit
MGSIKELQSMDEAELYAKAKKLGASIDLIAETRRLGKLPVVNFAAGGIATPADAALMMQLGSDGVFVGSGIFKSSDPGLRAKSIVMATTHFDDPKTLAEVSKGLGEPMKGIDIKTLKEEELLQTRGV